MLPTGATYCQRPASTENWACVTGEVASVAVEHYVDFPVHQVRLEARTTGGVVSITNSSLTLSPVSASPGLCERASLATTLIR